ncbi:unnamed protein product, partial [Brenthis ino]
MTLIGAILKKVTSKEVINESTKYTSPPPEINESLLRKTRKTRKHRYSHIQSIVDSSSPPFDGHRMLRNLPAWQRLIQDIYLDNVRIINSIITAYMRGRPRVVPTTELNRDWVKNKRDIVHMTKKKFVLFPVNVQDVMEDPSFAAPGDVLRPKY